VNFISKANKYKAQTPLQSALASYIWCWSSCVLVVWVDFQYSSIAWQIFCRVSLGYFCPTYAACAG